MGTGFSKQREASTEKGAEATHTQWRYSGGCKPPRYPQGGLDKENDEIVGPQS